MQVIQARNVRERVSRVRKLIQSAGNHIFAVSFIAKGTGQLRKMSCRSHVVKPQYVKAPTRKNSLYKKDIDRSNDLITVYDNNCLRYDKEGRLNGRGSYKSIPLANVTRIKVGGEIYKVMQ